jgi:hypothetical protein
MSDVAFLRGLALIALAAVCALFGLSLVRNTMGFGGAIVPVETDVLLLVAALLAFLGLWQLVVGVVGLFRRS